MSPSLPPHSNPPDTVLGRIAAVLAAILAAAALLLLAPHGVLDKADRAAYAVCHRIPDHTFSIAGRQLPLCARCSGTYLGTLAGLAVLALRGRGRAGRFPSRPLLFVLAGFMLAWAADGTNSFLALLGGPQLYPPSNTIRLVTGVLQGLAIAGILLPAFNIAFWQQPEDQASIAGWRDLAFMLAGGGLVVAAVASEWDALLYPLALLSGLAVPALLGALNAMLYVAVRRREGMATRGEQLLGPLFIGLALALGEIAAIGALRDLLVARFGWPF